MTSLSSGAPEAKWEGERVDWTGRKVLVTGAGGFIGSHLCEALWRAGADVRALLTTTDVASPVG